MLKKSPFYMVLRRELDRMVSRRLYFGVCIVLPLFCIFFMSTIFGSGQMENIPIAVVDQDNTSMSREIMILAYRDASGAMLQNVGSHQNRVGEQTHGGVLSALLLGLVLELGHTGRLTKAGEAVQNPRQLGVLGHVRLHKQRGNCK